ncbi:SH3 domain-containing protein [Flavobacterium sp. ZT3R17]|uniref:SH3 domain-containing protein n=1 Tax=Flavobacterium cryoconiti TaxID=3398736 RepID=UPI003A8C2388
MKLIKSNWFLLLFLSTQLAISQTYIVKPKTLNVRAETNKEANVIAKMNENDTIKAISVEGEWVKINISDKQGFVNKNYLEEIKPNEPQIKSGFKYGFSKAFSTSFIITLILLLGYRSLKGRVKDGRRTKGYREYDITFKDYIVDGIYALIIALFIALISGIISWIKTF